MMYTTASRAAPAAARPNSTAVLPIAPWRGPDDEAGEGAAASGSETPLVRSTRSMIPGIAAFGTTSVSGPRPPRAAAGSRRGGWARFGGRNNKRVKNVSGVASGNFFKFLLGIRKIWDVSRF
jgi:hypothetical protein